MRFGVSPEACRQALDLGFDWHLQRLSPAAQQGAQQVQEEAQAALQKVLLHGSYILAFSSVTGAAMVNAVVRHVGL